MKQKGKGKPFQPGHPNYNTAPTPLPGSPVRFRTPKMAKEILSQIVDWEEFWKTCYEEFKGGYTFINSKGLKVKARPSLDWARFLAEYGQMKVSDEAPAATAEELKVLSKIMGEYLLPNQPKQQ